MHNLLFITYEVIRIAGILYQPVMPVISKTILDQMEVSPNERSLCHAILGGGEKGRKIWAKSPLFPRI